METMKSYPSWHSAVRWPADWLALAGPGETRRVGRGTVLYRQGDRQPRFFLIRSGAVEVTIADPDGEPLLLEILGPGTLFGEGAAFEDAPRYVSATAAADCELGLYDAGRMREHILREPRVALELIRLMSAKQRTLAQKLAAVAIAEPETRVRHLLRRLAAGTADGNIALTHEEIAAMTGLSRVSVTRVLRAFAGEGLIVTHRGRIEVPPGSALRS
jgi:CRP/FNR family transcriptional regulator, cyclic AMP receptor protein